jgi:hypothetical protein
VNIMRNPFRRGRRRPPYDGVDFALRFPFPTLRDYPTPQHRPRGKAA